MFCVHEVFKWNKLAVPFKLTLGMITVVLCKYLNCAAEKTIVEGHTASRHFSKHFSTAGKR